MPLYEYQCDACGHRFEVVQRYADAPIDTCPKCGSAVHKLFSSPAIQFKGSGWYITDYARAGKSDNSSGSTAKTESSNGGGAAPESKTEVKTESKVEAKSEGKSESKPAAPSTSS
jgi:putative FmdB family regulatory protein